MPSGARRSAPTRVDPRGTVTEIERAASGRPERITRAMELPEQSDILGVYSGIGDPDLLLCGRPVSGIGSALIDLETLFDPADPHPLTVVGLVGFRGLAMFESAPADVGDVSFFNEACLDLGGPLTC